MRPGEKLFEELLLGDNVSGTVHSQIMRAEEDLLDEAIIDDYLIGLKQAAAENDCQKIHDILSEAVSGFYSQDGVSDVLWLRKQRLKRGENVVRALFNASDSSP